MKNDSTRTRTADRQKVQGLSRGDNPARVKRAKQAVSTFVPRLNGAGMPQRGIRYLLKQLQHARCPPAP